MRRFFITVTLALLILANLCFSQTVEDYIKVIEEKGREPVAFITEKLADYDLIIFDDALHASVEPFDFYCDYLKKNPTTIDLVFLEVVPMTATTCIDSFLNNPTKDISLLKPVFQQDFRYGWRYETYLDLFNIVWDINQNLPEGEKIRIIGVDQPIYWEGLHSREDYNLFQQSLSARDYFMYQQILKNMDDFKTGKKGLFLTNTRHAYKGIKNKDGKFHWNSGTFFHQWHPGKTYSVRFHNMILNISAEKKNVKNASMEGLDQLVYKWVRMDEGKWDKAFAENDNNPVAIPFENTIFGQHPYFGNHMANAMPGQTMADAYDALIFTDSLEETKFSAQTNFFYDEEFKQEVARRVRIIHEHDLPEFLQNNEVGSVEEYVEKLAEYVPEKPNPLIK
ncbi:MAG: hypothetical protein ACLFQM_08405 [Fidelibacterota bacterium]